MVVLTDAALDPLVACRGVPQPDPAVGVGSGEGVSIGAEGEVVGGAAGLSEGGGLAGLGVPQLDDGAPVEQRGSGAVEADGGLVEGGGFFEGAL